MIISPSTVKTAMVRGGEGGEGRDGTGQSETGHERGAGQTRDGVGTGEGEGGEGCGGKGQGIGHTGRGETRGTAYTQHSERKARLGHRNVDEESRAHVTVQCV